VTIEVSERDTTTAVTLNGTTVPGINKRRVATQAEMNFGDTMVIGGLIFTRYTAATNKIPFLGELPGVGALFRRENYTEAETELLVMITPEFVAPLPCDQVPSGGPGLFTDIPTDREFYGQGLIEVPAYGGGRCAPGACPPGGAPATGYGPTPETVPSPELAPPAGAAPPEPGLIAPPGIQAPPPPASDPSVSRRGSSRTTWPSTSSAQQLSSRNASGTNGSGIRQTGYQSRTDRSGGAPRAPYPPAASSGLRTAQ
jgi:pilus assembly protein CpaC